MMRKLLLALLLTIALPAYAGTIFIDEGPVPAAGGGGGSDVALDSVSALDPWDTDSNATVTSPSITVGAGSNRILVAFASSEDAVAGSAVVNGCSGSVDGAFTHLASSAMAFVFSAVIDYVSDVWYKLAPTTGAQTVTCTWSEAINAGSVGLVSLQNVNQSTPFGTVVTNTDTTGGPASTSVIMSSAAGDLCLAHVNTVSVSLAEQETTAGTQRWETSDYNYNGAASIVATIAAVGASTTGTFQVPGRSFGTIGVCAKK